MTQPKRPDEIQLYAALRAAADACPRGESYWGGRSAAMEIIQRLGVPERRAHYLLEKWYGNGWIDCGTWVWGGWFTDDAPKSLAP